MPPRSEGGVLTASNKRAATTISCLAPKSAPRTTAAVMESCGGGAGAEDLDENKVIALNV